MFWKDIHTWFLIKRFKKKFISSNQLIYENAHLYLNLSFIEKISLFYFQMIKINYLKKYRTKSNKLYKNEIKKKYKIRYNFLSNFFLKKYQVVCSKFFHLYKTKNPAFTKIIIKSLLKIKNKELEIEIGYGLRNVSLSILYQRYK